MDTLSIDNSQTKLKNKKEHSKIDSQNNTAKKKVSIFT